MKKMVNLIASIPVHTCLQFSFTIIRHVKAYMIKKSLSLVFKSCFWESTVIGWYTTAGFTFSTHLLIKVTAKPIFHWRVKMSFHEIPGSNIGVLKPVLSNCSKHSNSVSDTAFAAWWWMQTYGYKKLLRMQLNKRLMAVYTIWKFILLFWKTSQAIEN